MSAADDRNAGTMAPWVPGVANTGPLYIPGGDMFFTFEDLDFRHIQVGPHQACFIVQAFVSDKGKLVGHKEARAVILTKIVWVDHGVISARSWDSFGSVGAVARAPEPAYLEADMRVEAAIPALRSLAKKE